MLQSVGPDQLNYAFQQPATGQGFVFAYAFLAAPGTETLPVRMFLYIQDNIDPLVTSVSACVIAITMTALILLDRFYGLDRVLAGKGDTGR